MNGFFPSVYEMGGYSALYVSVVHARDRADPGEAVLNVH